MSELRVTIASSYDEVAPVGEAVRALCGREGMSALDAGLCELAVVEAINNAIEHAYGGGPDGRIDVRVSVDAARVDAEIVDAGAPIDPAAAAAPGSLPSGPVPREALAEGGRGLAIIRGIVDELTFERDGDRNRVRMIRRRTPAGR